MSVAGSVKKQRRRGGGVSVAGGIASTARDIVDGTKNFVTEAKPIVEDAIGVYKDVAPVVRDIVGSFKSDKKTKEKGRWR